LRISAALGLLVAGSSGAGDARFAVSAYRVTMSVVRESAHGRWGGPKGCHDLCYTGADPNPPGQANCRRSGLSYQTSIRRTSKNMAESGDAVRARKLKSFMNELATVVGVYGAIGSPPMPSATQSSQ
jgi:hypothetical protein